MNSPFNQLSIKRIFHKKFDKLKHFIKGKLSAQLAYSKLMTCDLILPTLDAGLFYLNNMTGYFVE